LARAGAANPTRTAPERATAPIRVSVLFELLDMGSSRESSFRFADEVLFANT
jgi:hypothetical protein